MEKVKSKSKRGYKQTKIGLIPDSWETMKLSDITMLITNGFVGKATDHYDENGNGVLYIQGYNVTENGFNLNGIKRVTTNFHNQNKKSCLKEGDLLTIQTGEVGVTTIVPKELEGSNCHALVISRYLPNLADPKFFVQYFNSSIGRRFLKSIETGSTMKHLNVGDMVDLLLPVPPLPEQQKIARILSTWDRAIEKTEQLIAQKQQLKKGLMQQLLTGKVRFKEFKDKKFKLLVISDLIEFSGGSQPPRSTFIFKETNGYVRLIQNRDYKSDNFKTYIPEDLVNKKCDETDIMIGRYGPPLFQLYRGLRGAYNVALIKAIPDENKLLKEYCWYYLNRPELQKYIDGFSQRSGGQTGIEMDRLNSYPFPLPNLREQEKIVDVLRLIDTSIAKHTDELNQLKEQKKGLMQKLLTGEVRVKV